MLMNQRNNYRDKSKLKNDKEKLKVDLLKFTKKDGILSHSIRENHKVECPQIEEEKEEEKIPFKPNYNLVHKDNDDLESLPDVVDEFDSNENKPLNRLMENRDFNAKNPMPVLNIVMKKE